MNALDYVNHPGHPDHDPLKDRDWVPLTSEAQAAAAREKVLTLLKGALDLLTEATTTAEPLTGWLIPVERIRRQAVCTASLYEKTATAYPPSGHAHFS